MDHQQIVLNIVMQDVKFVIIMENVVIVLYNIFITKIKVINKIIYKFYNKSYLIIF